MKLIGLMSLSDYKNEIREMLKRHKVHIYSEVDIVGHTADTLRKYGWWSSSSAPDENLYSTLYFTIVEKDLAEAVMNDISEMPQKEDDDHPPRAFMVNIEKMV